MFNLTRHGLNLTSRKIIFFLPRLNHNFSNSRPKTHFKSRLHSSRMRTAHALTVSPSILCARGVHGPGGWGGVHGSGGGAWSRGMHGPSGGGIPSCTEADPPPVNNHRRLWKYNLAPTSLRAVIIRLLYEPPKSFELTCGSLVINHTLICAL